MWGENSDIDIKFINSYFQIINVLSKKQQNIIAKYLQ